MSSRFGFIAVLLLSTLWAAVSAADQQSGKIPRIAIVSLIFTLSEMSGPEPANSRIAAFLQQLRELGWIEGQNIHIERRSAEGQADRLPAIMAELVDLPIDVIFAVGSPTSKAAVNTIRTIPIVGAPIYNPVEQGLAASLAHPGGNFTGFTAVVDFNIDGKFLQLLKQAVPAIKRVGVLTHSGPPIYSEPPITPELTEATRQLNIELQPVMADKPEELEDVLATLRSDGPDALLLYDTPFNFANRQPLIEFALQNRLPSFTERVELVDDGFMMGYGTNSVALFRGAAGYVDRILKGSRPGDLPIQQPTRFDLILNKKTAKAIGVEFPYDILIQATRVIE
jgi:putative ABC transport system substrate-binding protein